MWRNWQPENWGTQGEVFVFFLHTSTDPSAKISLMIQLLISQMKELGVIVYNCSCLVLDLQRIFALYSSLRYKNKIPPSWSKRLYGVYDTQNKLTLQLNETKSEAFVSVSSEMSSRVSGDGGKRRNLLNPQDLWKTWNSEKITIFLKNSGFYDMQFARTEDAAGFYLSIIQFLFLCDVQPFSTHVQKMIQRPFKLNSFIYTNG